MSLFNEIPLSWLGTNYSADLQKIEDSAFLIKELSDVNIELSEIYSNLYEAQVPDNFIKNQWRFICDVSSDYFKSFIQEKGLSRESFGEKEFKECRSRFDISKRFQPGNITQGFSIKSHEQWNVKNESYFPLLDYQEDVFIRAKELLTIPYNKFVIQMPTGSGKTRTAMELVCEILNKKKSVLWLANTEELCDQAFETFLNTWQKKHLVNSEAFNLPRFTDSKNMSSDNDKPTFYVSSVQGLWSNNNVSSIITEKKLFKYVDLVVFDEAHMAIAKTYKKIITSLLANSNYSSKFIGLTATPGRALTNSLKRFNSEIEDDNRSLSDFFLNQKISLKPKEFGTALDFLRARGVIAKVELKRIQGLTINNEEYNGVSEKLLKIVSSSNERNFNIIATLLVQLRAEKRILLFANSIEHSRFIVSIISSLGFNAQHLDANSSGSRAELIRDFKKGEIQLLSNYGILSTGFDDPKLDVIFISRVTKSIVLYSQMIGRVLRGPIINGTSNATVFTIDDNIKGLPKNEEIYNYFDTYFDSK
tara:strand:- start:137 stop:1735 length:1599 start_codon:yes stop_codon:yes gene_type:complete